LIRTTLDGLVVKLFGDVQRRWLETTFPFTHPSLEAEIFFKGAWLEVCLSYTAIM
jgi:phenylalanyl-tRNA synthetase alpha chain